MGIERAECQNFLSSWPDSAPGGGFGTGRVGKSQLTDFTDFSLVSAFLASLQNASVLWLARMVRFARGSLVETV